MICLFVIQVISHYGFEGKILVLFGPVPVHRLPFMSLNITVIFLRFSTDTTEQIRAMCAQTRLFAIL